VLPVVLFGAIGFVSLDRLTQHWSELQFLKLGHEILSLIFIAMLVTLFAIRRAPVSQRASPFATTTAIAGTFISWIILAQLPTIDDWRVLTFGDLLMVCGLIFTLFSLGALGRCFGLAPEARGLVTSGAYRWVRHPVYLGELVTVIGGALPLLAPLTILVFAVFCVLQLRRISLEETVLKATFPDYEEYRCRTPALLPWGLLH
jgi:protein-S-isoprenylcysteine O-methyltransferase Ste14